MPSLQLSPIQNHPRRAQRRDNTIAFIPNNSHVCLMYISKVTAITLLVVKILLFLYDKEIRRRPFYYNARLPLRERHGTAPTTATKSLRLNFHQNTASDRMSFKILQLTDMHFGEATFTDWGPEQDRKTFQVLETVIPLEKPDLIVLSGDQLTANDIGQKNATSYYSLLGEHLSTFGIPWALIFGNHDDAPFERKLDNGTVVKTPAMTSRSELLATDMKFSLSLTQLGRDGLFGTSNYALPVYFPSRGLSTGNLGATTNTATNNVGLQLIFLDSGGGSLPMKLEQNQMNWFQKEHLPAIPGAAIFQHIPTQEFSYDGTYCEGLHDDPVDSVEEDPGIVALLQDAGNVLWLGVGHDHGNGYCCRFNSRRNNSSITNRKNVHLCFGRHSGYGGYGHWDRGARIYDVELIQGIADSATPRINWQSWVRLETGDIVDRYRIF